MATIYHLASGDAQRELEVFSEEFDQALALGDVDQWSTRLGHHLVSDALKTTFPIPVDAAGYKRREGDDKMRKLFQRSTSIIPVEWQDGIREQARVVEDTNFIGWAGAPARMAMEAMRHPNRMVADLLFNNPFIDFYADEKDQLVSEIRLFADNHPVNVFDAQFGVFGNQFSIGSIAVTGSNHWLSQAKNRFRTRPGPNGSPLGLRLATILAPPSREEEFRDLLEADVLLNTIAAGRGSQGNRSQVTENRHKGTVDLIIGEELREDNVFYLLGNGGTPAWVVQEAPAPEQIIYDKTDERYKDSGEIGFKSILNAGASAVLPHAIERITIE